MADKEFCLYCGWQLQVPRPGLIAWLVTAIVLFILIGLIKSQGAEIVDLGIVTDKTLIELSKCERRTDFARFKIEFLPKNRRGETNKVEIITTNEVLSLADLAAVPTGYSIMGVRSICHDGEESPLALFAVNIQRDPPNAPKAKTAQILTMPVPQRIEDVVEAAFEDKGPPPPLPPGMVAVAASAVKSPLPLPGGTNVSYSEHRQRIERALANGERRSR